MTDPIIEMDGNIVRYIDRTVRREVPLEDFLSKLEHRVPANLPSIGRTQVYAYFDETDDRNKVLYALCELPPGIRTIRKRTSSGMRSYRLGVPWTFFWWRANTSEDPQTTTNWGINSGQVFVGRHKFDGIDTEFIPAPFPNLSGDGGICWGNVGVGHRQSLANQLDERTTTFFNTEFNTDLDRHIRLPYGAPTMKRWVEETAENPTAWMDWPEFTSPDTFKYSVRRLLQEHAGITFPDAPPVWNASVAIPEPELPMTYGRWDQFHMSLPAEERMRALISLQNLRADNPEFVPETPTIPTAPIIDYNDDGGIPI